MPPASTRTFGADPKTLFAAVMAKTEAGIEAGRIARGEARRSLFCMREDCAEPEEDPDDVIDTSAAEMVRQHGTWRL